MMVYVFMCQYCIIVYKVHVDVFINHVLRVATLINTFEKLYINSCTKLIQYEYKTLRSSSELYVIWVCHRRCNPNYIKGPLLLEAQIDFCQL